MTESLHRALGYRSGCFVAAIILVSLGGGCTAPQYDDQTDKLISTLQSDVDTEFITLMSLSQKIDALKDKMDAASKRALADAKTKAGYDANVSTYDKISVDLISVQLRVDASPNASTSHLDTALKYLHDNLFGDKSLQTTHQQEDILSAVYIKNEEIIIDQQLEALLAYELVLKNGASSSSTSSK